MNRTVIVLAIAFALVGVVALPAAEAAPPNIGGEGCDYFHWHNGNVAEGQLPGYHWHPCL